MSNLSPVSIINIHISEDGRRKFIPSGENIDKILLNHEVKDRKIVILSVLGEYRKGKSFFLGYCLRFLHANFASLSNPLKPSPDQSSGWFGAPNDPLKGFKGKHGRQADTKGILLWPDVFLHDTEDGEKIAIILMDTQGLFETSSSEDENAKIFGLTTLISSMQIVNLKDVIQENQIENLESATSLSKHISQFKKSQWKPFQMLLFLIRDWSDTSIDLGFEGGEKYLEEFLSSNGSNTKAQMVRTSIRDSFDSIKCYLLNRPGDAVQDPTFKGEWAHLDEIFTANLKRLVESLLSPQNLIKKSVFGKEVNGAEFRDYLNAYFEAFQKAKLPETENIYEAMVNNEFKAIIEELLENYKSELAKDVNFDHEDFEAYIEEKHQRAKADAVLEFHRIQKIQDAEKVLKFQCQLMEEIEKFFKSWRETILCEHQMHLQHKKQVEELQDEMQKQQEQIKIFEENLKAQEEENQKLMVEVKKKDKDLKEQELKNRELQDEMQKKEEYIKQQEEENKGLKDEMEKKQEEINISQENLKLQEEANKELNNEMKKKNEEVESFKESLRMQKEKNEELEKLMDEEKKKLEEEKEKLSGEIEKLQQESAKKNKEMQEVKDSIRKLNEEHEKSVEVLKADFDTKMKEVEDEMEEKSRKEAEKRDELAKEHQQEIQKLHKENAEKDQKVKKAQDSIHELEAKYEKSKQDLQENFDAMKKKIEAEIEEKSKIEADKREELAKEHQREIEALQQERKNKDEEILKTQDLIRELNELNDKTKKEMQDSIEEIKKKVKDEMEEKSKKEAEEREELVREHQREMDRMKKAQDKFQDEQDKKLKEQQEGLKRRDEEAKREQEKKFQGTNQQRRNLWDLNDTIDDESEKIEVDILKSIASIVNVVTERSLGKKELIKPVRPRITYM